MPTQPEQPKPDMRIMDKIRDTMNLLRRTTVAAADDTELWELLHAHEENFHAEINAFYERRGWGKLL